MNRKKLGISLIALGTVVAIAGTAKFNSKPAPTPAPVVENDIKAATVMITTRSMDHGGTGLILNSSKNRSIILTNDHVCKAITKGGVVTTESNNTYQVTSILESQMSDLCMLTVASDLYLNTRVSAYPPNNYDKATIVGHPALLPTVVTEGHVSGRRIIQVVTGVRKCTADDEAGPLGMLCLFFGGMPVLKSYESRLVTATIMPGSSGSGVYNENKDLIGLVFAGSGDLGYAWTVPYEQVVNFLAVEHQHLTPQLIDQEVSLTGESEEASSIRTMRDKCVSHFNSFKWRTVEERQVALGFCNVVKRDAVWRKVK